MIMYSISIPTRLVNSCCGARGGLGDRAACRRSLRRGSAGHREKPTQIQKQAKLQLLQKSKKSNFRFFHKSLGCFENRTPNAERKEKGPVITQPFTKSDGQNGMAGRERNREENPRIQLDFFLDFAGFL